MWLFFAVLSAITAALVAIFAKAGLQAIDPTLATTIRSIIMAIFLIFTSILLKKFQNFSLSVFNSTEWLMIILAGIAGALSWLFYFLAIKVGKVSAVAAIDRLSIVFVVILAVLFLNEALKATSIIGAIFVVIGAILISI
jgi:transporter family protein